MMTTNIKIAGLGGMGVLKASLILAEVLFKEGYDVKKSEVHGMAQRGGSVCSDVRFGEQVKSPMIPSREVDYLLLLEPADMPLYQNDIRDDTYILSSSDIEIDKLESRRAINIALLGGLSSYLPILEKRWLDVIHQVLPKKVHSINDAAFRLGRETAGKEIS